MLYTADWFQLQQIKRYQYIDYGSGHEKMVIKKKKKRTVFFLREIGVVVETVVWLFLVGEDDVWR